jgi:hypothetical protein
MVIVGMVSLYNTNISNSPNQNAFAHNFSPIESASFLSLVTQLQVESELVETNLANNNISLAREHANKVTTLLTSNITEEIAERNERVAKELDTAINDLRDTTNSFSASSSLTPSQQKQIDQLVNDIDAILGEAVTTRIDLEQGDNATIQAIAFAESIDNILTNYGNAFSVEFDMTNMSNMDTMRMASGNISSTSTSLNTATTPASKLANMSDYQSAQALATKVIEIFNSELKPLAPGNSDRFMTKLEDSLAELGTSIKNNVQPMEIMEIIHEQVHPNLGEAYNLQLQ